MIAHEVQSSHAMFNCALQVLNCDYPSSNITQNYSMLTPSSSNLRIKESKETLTLSKINTCIILPIGLPVFSNRYDIKLNKDHKGLSRLVTGLR
ncbi:hypothetical protein H5410_003398, partial [Solanum commersonii]